MQSPLDGQQQYWDGYAATDPLWAVLAFPDKRGGRWPLQEFMKTGEREIALLFHQLSSLQLDLPATSALDFGCGVGRLTQALARRQARVVGADISKVMVDFARRLNQYPDRATYLCTAETGLDTLPPASFAFIYTNIVLQHVPPDVAVQYLGEFFRLLEPRGLLVFQLPSHRDSPVDAEITAMPDAAYRGAIELAAPVHPTVAAGAHFTVTLRVRNISAITWSQPTYGPLAIGNHWLDARGDLMLKQDDGRAPMLQVVPPDLEWPVLIRLHAPGEPGRYVCEFDLVHEGITWFSDKGSPTLRFAIDVVTGTEASPVTSPMIQEFPVPLYPDDVLPPAPATVPEGPASFPMNGVHREHVMRIIRERGGRLIYLEEDRRAGPEWVSYRYFVSGP